MCFCVSLGITSSLLFHFGIVFLSIELFFLFSLGRLFSLFPITEPEENALEDVLRVEVELFGQGADGATGRGFSRYLDAFHCNERNKASI